MNEIDPIEAERRRLAAQRAASSINDSEDPIVRARRELSERRQRLVSRQHEHHPRSA